MNKKYKKDLLRAGEIAGGVRRFGKELIRPGASYNAVVKQVIEKIEELGAVPAFPPQIALNTVAAHFLPQPEEDIVFSNEVVKLDVGVCYDGAIGDCAVTVDLSGNYQTLIDAAEAALRNAQENIRVGLPLREIGKIIEETIGSFGLKPVRNLSGHGLGYYKIHTPPMIPNYDDRSKGVVKAGMTFAIEPFATNGKGMIFEGGEPTIFSLAKVRPVTSAIARKVLAKIMTFKGLPFSLHDMVSREIPLADAREGIAFLLKNGVILGYPPLIEQGGGMVAQAENSVLVDEAGVVTITTLV
jgi:methionyl aminopeptidase